jgi:hypothetical protein
MNHINDSTQEFPSPSVCAGSVAFLFAQASPQELDTTMCTLGAASKVAPFGPGWRFPAGSQPLLDFDLIEDVEDYAIDLIWKAWCWYIPLLDAVGVGPQDAVILKVVVRNEPSAHKALRTFALRLLDNHRGAVKDSVTNQVWTRDEIENDTIRGGQKFFGHWG